MVFTLNCTWKSIISIKSIGYTSIRNFEFKCAEDRQWESWYPLPLPSVCVCVGGGGCFYFHDFVFVEVEQWRRNGWSLTNALSNVMTPFSRVHGDI